MLITGALHEDGLADCADGLGATSDRQKALEIMRDSTIGTYGALALASTFLLRWAALSALEPVAGFLALLIAHGTSRSAMIIMMRFADYARPEGLGKLAAGHISANGFGVAIILPLAVALVIGSLLGTTSAVLGLLSGWCLMKYFVYRIGGYTGDCLGAVQQVAEITVLVSLVGFWT